MWLAVLTLMRLITGIVTEDTCAANPFETCSFEIKNLVFPRNERHLDEACRKIKNYYSCYQDQAKLYQPGNLCGWPLVLKYSEGFLYDICVEKTSLVDRYLKSASCILFKTNVNEERCQNVGDDMYRLYMEYSKAGKFVKEIKSLEQCIKILQKFDCLATEIEKGCGNEALETFHEILKRSKYYYLYCKGSGEYNWAKNVGTEIAYLTMGEKIPEYERIKMNF